MMKSDPAAARARRTISTGNRRRLSALPPHPSLRLLVRGAKNWLIIYPSLPMISTPSYPASRASCAQRAKSSIVLCTPLDESRRGRNGLIGALIDDALTESGWYAYRPACRICSRILPPASCTALVMRRCRPTCPDEVRSDAHGSSPPVRLGA